MADETKQTNETGIVGTIELYKTGRYESFGHRAIYESRNRAWTLLVPANVQTTADQLGNTIEITVRRA